MENKINKSTMIWFSALSMLGFLATDMYLPAFENIRVDLGTTGSMIGLSLSVFLLGMAIGQLVHGPLSDRIGRIKVLMIGMSLFVISTVAISFSTNIEMFLFARFMQALGACSGTVLWQAVVIDRYQGKQSERVFATIMPLVALSPALAPILGAGIEKYLGWQSIFLVLAVLGLVVMLVTRTEKESAPLNSKQEKISDQLKRDYKTILKSKKFIGNMLIFGGCSAAFFAYLTGSPLIMHSMNYSGADIGLSYIPQTIAFLIGGYGCRSLLSKFESKKILPWFIALFVLSVIIMFWISIGTELTTIVPILIPFCLLAVANGAIYPIVISEGLSSFKNCSATAAGLMNFLQTMFCFIASGLTSAFIVYEVTTVTTIMLFQALIILFGLFLTKKNKAVPAEVESIIVESKTTA